MVTEVVAQLVERGLLERRTASDGTVLYRMNPARIEELQRLLKKEDGSVEDLGDER